MKTTMVIADDHEVLREALLGYATQHAGYEITGSVSDAQSAVSACARQQPDLLLLDIEMPGRDPLAAIADIKAASPRTKVVILSGYCRDTFIQAALRGGVNGYLLKSDATASIFASLARVVEGGSAFSKQVYDRIVAGREDRGVESSGRTRLTDLTPRELEVLRYIGRGLANEQMAKTMTLSKRTVERHVARLMDSLAIRDRSSLQRFAVEQGVTV
jgi:DNA-binding NarL/FixJ family response regulator